MSDLEKLQKKIGYKFKNISLLVEALTHRSYANEHQEEFRKNNERLEFLGDSVLDIITTEYLYNKFDENEGKLSKKKSQIISEKIFSEIAIEINLGQYLLLSNGEVLTGGRERTSILGDAFEALIGAIYIDSNLDEARKIALKFLKDTIDNFDNIEHLQDYKTELQEIIQLKYKMIPTYILENTYGPDHNKMFQISVYVGEDKMGIGFAKSKKEAEKIAAKNALLQILEKENI